MNRLIDQKTREKIRRVWAEEKLPKFLIAKRFEISRSVVSRILKEKGDNDGKN